MKRGLVLLGAAIVVVAACSVEPVAIGTIDVPDAGVASAVDAEAEVDVATSRCPPISDNRSLDRPESLLSILDGYWRICNGSVLWDAPSATVGLAISGHAVYFAAPSGEGKNVLDPSTRHYIGVLTPASSFPAKAFEIQYGVAYDLDVVLSSDGNHVLLRDHFSQVAVSLVRTDSSFL